MFGHCGTQISLGKNKIRVHQSVEEEKERGDCDDFGCVLVHCDLNEDTDEMHH